MGNELRIVWPLSYNIKLDLINFYFSLLAYKIAFNRKKEL